LRLVAVVLLGGSAVAGQSALAQEAVSSTVDGTTISVGGGIQFLWLPDIKFTGAGKPSNFHFQTNSEFTAYGPAADAKIETQLGYWGGYRVSGSLRGFWSNSTTAMAGAARAAVLSSIPPPASSPMVLRFHPYRPRRRLLGRLARSKVLGAGSRPGAAPICFAPTICSSVPIYAASTRTTT
jgi:hypothetical protein